MVDLIIRFLSIHKRVSIKGIGSFSAEQLPARLDFPNRLLYAPEVILHYSSKAEEDILFDTWLEKQLALPQHEIKSRKQIFIDEFIRTLNSNREATLEGIGQFVKDENQLISFNSMFETIVGPPVTAERIIRKNAPHAVRVGEDEKTSVEMEELLFGEKRKARHYWWFIAMLLFLIGIIAVWYYASSKPLPWKMQGNINRSESKEMPVLYQKR
jgi:nucleoid DNA-binding protein